MNSVLIIMPAYNEEENIGQVLHQIKELDLPADLLVIDDGSSDETAAVVKKAGVKLIGMPYNSGYGVACQTGFKYALEAGYDYVVQMDSDGQHQPEDLPLLLKVLMSQEADIVIGSRFLSKMPYPMGRVRKFAVKVFCLTIRLVSKVTITDPSSGLQGLNRKTFAYYSVMDNYPEDYPDADVLIRMLLAGYKVKEVAATFKQRSRGKSMHSGFEPLFYMLKVNMSILLIVLRDHMERRKRL